MNATEMTNEQQAKAKAEAYLKQKSRLTYYIFSGYTAEDDDFEHGFYIASTPEEMQQLVQEIIETYNQYYSDSKPVTTLLSKSRKKSICGSLKTYYLNTRS